MTVELDLNEADAEEVTENLEAFGAILYTAEHAAHVNFDTAWTGSQPPFEPLRGWVHRKWNDLSDGLKLAALSEDAAEAEEIAARISQDEWKDQVTWLVIRAIAKNGIEGIHFAERALSKGQNSADAIAKNYEDSDDPDAPFKIIQDVIDLMFGESQDIIADEAFDRGTLLRSGSVEVSREPIAGVEEDG